LRVAATDQNERAADLLERLLTDKAFRASFRKNPSAAARKYGLDELADELAGKGKALHTLEIRESRSSLAGMMMAAAAPFSEAISYL
jgi:putative modified peptide